MWGATVLALVCVGITTAMGLWQYGAWQASREAEQRDLTGAEPVPVTDVLGPDEPFPARDVGRPVRLAGTWLPEGTVLVAGRETEDGRTGRWVVTPLTVGGPEDPAVPVVRGFLEDGEPEPRDGPLGEAEVVGWLQPSEGTGATDSDPDDDVLPQLRVADIVQRVEQDLYGAYVVLDPDATADSGVGDAGTAGLEPATLDQLPPAGQFTGLRNLLYAVEWWVFAAFAAFVWWRYVRDVSAQDPAAEAGPASDAAPDSLDA